VVLAATLLIDGFLGFPLATKFSLIWSAESGQAFDARIPIWSAAWGEFLSSPLWGHGPHTFHYTSLDSIGLSWPHNLYLEILAEQGMLGFSALGFLLVCGLSAAWKTQRDQISEIRILGAGSLAGLLGFCFAALVELSFLRQWVVIVFFTLLAVISHLASYRHEQEDGI
jgi:O-antigen ligase